MSCRIFECFLYTCSRRGFAMASGGSLGESWALLAILVPELALKKESYLEGRKLTSGWMHIWWALAWVNPQVIWVTWLKNVIRLIEAMRLDCLGSLSFLTFQSPSLRQFWVALQSPGVIVLRSGGPTALCILICLVLVSGCSLESLTWHQPQDFRDLITFPSTV